MNKTMRLQQKTEVIHNTLKKSVPYDLAKVEGLVSDGSLPSLFFNSPYSSVLHQPLKNTYPISKQPDQLI